MEMINCAVDDNFIRVTKDGYVKLSDEDIEKIAELVVKKLKETNE